MRGQAIIGQSLEAEGGDSAEIGSKLQFVGIALGHVAADEDGGVRLDGEQGEIRFRLHGAERRPGDRAPGSQVKPLGELAVDHFATAHLDWRGIGRGGRIHAQADPPQGVLLPVLLAEADGEPHSAREVDGIFKSEGGRMPDDRLAIPEIDHAQQVPSLPSRSACPTGQPSCLRIG